MQNPTLPSFSHPVDRDPRGDTPSGVQRIVAPPVERWTISAHLRAPDGAGLTVVAVFGRLARRDGSFAHAVTWALADGSTSEHRCCTAVDATSALACLERVRAGRWSSDPRLDRAVAEILARGRVPKPDELLAGEARVEPGGRSLVYGDNRLTTDELGRHHLVLGGQGGGCTLVLEPTSGDAGRCRVSGVLARSGGGSVPVEGVGRHAFSRDDDPLAEMQEARLDLHLDDGADVVVAFRPDGGAGEAAATWVDAGGARRVVPMTIEATTSWQSTRTFREYPVGFRLQAADLALDLEVTPAFLEQELVSLVGAPTVWLGRVDVRGRVAGRERSGVGAVVSPPRESHDDLESFFRAVGKVVRASAARALPRTLDRRAADLLVAGAHTKAALDGVDLDQLSRTLVHPIRDIVDRGGKAWRSYAAIACCDLVGGDSRKFVTWLAMPELMHVGSLIVDDVQDRSVIRRGGPAAHVLHGEAQAINAGTAAYFLTQRILATSDHLSDADRLVLYDLYFAAMRAGHAGQAIDLDGLDDALLEAATTGDATVLEQRVLAVHRLKTALPAACLARMGAVAGGGTQDQIDAVGAFFEALGLAFQIIDDVLNLRGFAGDLKSKGEDVSHGKVTMPIALAMGLLDRERRAWLAETLRSRPDDPETVAAVIRTLESCGALDACRTQATALVEASFVRLDAACEDSLAKVMLRAFSWFVLERHY